MLRLMPPDHLRFVQADSFNAMYAGAELNVAVSLANYGVDAAYVTRLPEHEIGTACLQQIRRYGIDSRFILRGGDRLGAYFVERGAAQRGSKVIYDRAHSAISQIKPGMFDWDAIFEGADWFHWTGITPALSEGCAEVSLEALEAAKKHGVTTSCDLNYRSKLWKWGKEPEEVMEDLVALTDVVVGNEADADDVFGIHAEGTDVTKGEVDAEKYRSVCEQLHERFPKTHTVAITLRGSLSASRNTWSAILWKEGDIFIAPQYDILPIVDRVGGGDSFNGGLIYGLNTYDDPQTALNFAVAASCLKHSIYGDFNHVTVAEVEKIMGGNVSGRVSR
jgi:2-dehydro-3-deoxygluconokinase